MEENKLTELTLTVNEIDAFPDRIAAVSQEDYNKIGSLSRKHLVLSPKTKTKSINQEIYVSELVVIPSYKKGEIGLTKAMKKKLKTANGKKLSARLEIRFPPDSYNFIKKRMKSNSPFIKPELDTIVSDITSGRLNELEKSALILSQYFQDYSMDEIEFLCRAIADTGDTVDFQGIACDKHSLGGVPGNKVSLLLVPIVAAAGLLIPKTSSRAITSASGTGDTMEALGCRVSFQPDEIIDITSKTNGMICWGGALNLAPADDILINDVEFPLGINPRSMMMASIMAKKKAFGIETLVLDMPTGKGCKVETLAEAQVLSRSFGELGRRLDIRVECGITYGSSPVGHNIGPALEAREALDALINPKEASNSLIEKSTTLAGILLEMMGKALRGQGQAKARDILYKGDAYSKMKEIMEAQEADPNIKPEEIPVGEYTFEYIAPTNGWIVEIDNTIITRIAKSAGAPTVKGAGIEFLRKKQAVKAGEAVFRVHAETEQRLRDVEAVVAKSQPVTIEGMLLGRI
ncbi:MAG: AMP phosphorylase [Candidatus Heimdallarchaeota archaeon LC_3]|nr:MAG: AMP phosphorylase [Candidatus Heimdallarchaeota archaeon LC_3]